MYLHHKYFMKNIVLSRDKLLLIRYTVLNCECWTCRFYQYLDFNLPWTTLEKFGKFSPLLAPNTAYHCWDIFKIINRHMMFYNIPINYLLALLLSLSVEGALYSSINFHQIFMLYLNDPEELIFGPFCSATL